MLRAPQVRLHTRLPDLPGLRHILNDALHPDHGYFHPDADSWIRTGIFVGLERQPKAALVLPWLRDVNFEDGHLQNKVYKVLEADAAVEFVKGDKVVMESKLGRMLLGELPLGMVSHLLLAF